MEKDQPSNFEIVLKAFDEFTAQVYANSVNKGFWRNEDKLLDVLEELDDTESLSSSVITLQNTEKLALIVTEVAELIEGCRNSKINDPDEHCPEFSNFEIELADIILRVMTLAGRREARLGEALVAKHNFNLNRPFKHGKAF